MLSSGLTLGDRITFIGGKGGVGKTTVSAALGVELADRGEQVTVVSVDPAHSLGDAFGASLGSEPVEIAGVPGLRAMEVDADRERRLFLREHGEAIDAIVERGTYLDPADVDGLTGLELPGMDEIAALLALSRLAAEGPGRMIIDTAPTGHTLRLLQLPGETLHWVEALEAMQAKHAAVAAALSGSVPEDSASAFLDDLRADLEALDALLRDPAATRFVLVTTTEPVVLAETRRYQASLEELGVAPAGIVVNRATGGSVGPSTAVGMVHVPALGKAVVAVDGLRELARLAGADPDIAAQPPAGEAGRLTASGPYVPPLDRVLYLVGGKGGVGKSSAAAALALRLAEEGREVLLLSVDPAGSLGEVLDDEVGSVSAPVRGAEKLHARQLDAAVSWTDFTARYRGEVERLFTGLVAGGASATLDRQVMERLIDLAPPGLDELMALVEVIDLSEDRVYDTLVLDTAPTGHLLRLLELPELALEWTHAILRLLLKYREVIPLGGLGERILKLARNLRSLRSDLTDAGRTFVLVVALPESLSVPETGRLVDRLRSLQMAPGALLVNRALDSDGRVAEPAEPFVRRLLAIDPAMATAAAPLLPQGPAGADELRRYLAGWRRVQEG